MSDQTTWQRAREVGLWAFLAGGVAVFLWSAGTGQWGGAAVGGLIIVLCLVGLFA